MMFNHSVNFRNTGSMGSLEQGILRIDQCLAALNTCFGQTLAPKTFCSVLGFFDLVHLITFLKADVSLEKSLRGNWLRL